MKVQDLFEVTASKAARYQVKWKGYPGNPKPETHGIGYFEDDMGFDSDDRESVKDLAVGESHTMGGPIDSVRVTRLTDGVVNEAARAASDKGYYTPGYDAEKKQQVGTVADWLARMDVSKENIIDAVKQVKELASYTSLVSVVKDVTTAGEAKNGTFSFLKSEGEKYSEKYHVYANGLIRSSSKTSPYSDKAYTTKLKSPKPKLVAGSPVKSMVSIYDGAFKELLTKAAKRTGSANVAYDKKRGA